VIFAELICAVLVALGLFTRMATVPLIITMAVAFFVAHGADPFAKKELAFLYMTGFLGLFFTGPGDFSVQRFFKITAGRWTWLLD
jgi:putative oxidoreductase